MTKDRRLVALQLGRAPRGSWRTAARCSFGRPTVVATKPRLGDGAPFPTLFWLTCPHAAEEVAALESAGEGAAWTRLLAEDTQLAAELSAAEEEYRRARRVEGEGEDPCAGGIGGRSDRLHVKCLHAHAAAFLAGVEDPIGAAVADACEMECADDSCRDLLLQSGA